MIFSSILNRARQSDLNFCTWQQYFASALDAAPPHIASASTSPISFSNDDYPPHITSAILVLAMTSLLIKHHIHQFWDNSLILNGLAVPQRSPQYYKVKKLRHGTGRGASLKVRKDASEDEKGKAYNVSLQHVWMVVVSLSLIWSQSRRRIESQVKAISRQLSPCNSSLSGVPGDSMHSYIPYLWRRTFSYNLC